MGKLTVASTWVSLGVVVACWVSGCTDKSSSGYRSASAGSAKGAFNTSVYKPTATFQEIMDSLVDPASDYIWHAVSTTSDSKGVHENRPANDSEWLMMRHQVIQLIEAANVLSVPGRKVSNNSQTVELGEKLDVEQIQQRLDSQHELLVGFADNLRHVSVKLLAAVDAKNLDEITEVGGELDAACEACHKVFWYPEGPSAPKIK